MRRDGELSRGRSSPGEGKKRMVLRTNEFGDENGGRLLKPDVECVCGKGGQRGIVVS